MELEKEIQENLFSMQEEAYGDFQAKLMPDIQRERIIGVRTPTLREYAKKLVKKETLTKDFLRKLPHTYFEENQLQAFLISQMKDYDRVIEELNRFLPYVDNWATCDQMRPAIFKKNQNNLTEQIENWLHSTETYTIRFGVGMLMAYYLDGHFQPEHLTMVTEISSQEYYVNMMRAWYFATALAKHWEDTVVVLREQLLDVWTHNKTIQKARESFRINSEQKEYLKSLKR